MKTLIASYDTYIIDTMLIYIYDHIAWCNIVSYHRISLYTIAPTETPISARGPKADIG